MRLGFLSPFLERAVALRSGAKRAAAGVRAGAIGFIVLAAVRLAAAAPLPDDEALKPPAPARLAAILQAAQRDGWDRQAEQLQATARRAYERGKYPAAAAWFDVYRWAKLLGEDEAVFVPRWILAVQAARVAHANMATRYEARSRPLGQALSPELQAWLLAHPDFSREFFAVLQPVDFVPAVFRTLDELHRADPARFGTYAALALAIAVVHDVPPPPAWPHPQVSASAFPGRWPAPLAAFAWWTRQDRLGRTYQRLASLGAAELKFVVDAAASFDDLEWTQQVANYPLNRLERAYTMIRYRPDRANRAGAVWTDTDYSLPRILGQGGICVDQAYFAAQVGKARGVPTLLFRGAGNDGLHAWFGFLDGAQHWQLDAGRYAEQRFVTGYALDPQTWSVISDHELRFLSERFRTRDNFRRSQIHADFAADYLASGDAAAAVRAARQAVGFEPRNRAAWEVLLAAGAATDRDPKQGEATLREAALAFQRYPDLELLYSRRLCERLRARGEGSAADYEERRLARKYQGERTDLSVQQAREILLRSVATQPLANQIGTYNSLLDNFGRRAGFAFYEQVVAVFVGHLREGGHRSEARHAAERARGVLAIEPGGQLDQELTRTIKELGR